MGFLNPTQFKKFINSPIGKTWAKIKTTGKAALEKGYKFFKKGKPSNNTFPENNTFARIVDKSFAEKIKTGELTLSKPNFGNEAFVTAFDDVKGISDPKDLAKKLGLFQDKAGTKLVDTSNYTVLKFKFKKSIEQSLRTPIELMEKRDFGFITGGQTSGGAREWLIDNDAFKKGLIDFID